MEYTPDLFLPEDISLRIKLVPSKDLSPQQRRILQYLRNQPGAYTHEISAECASGHPTCRIQELNKGILRRYGLYIRGERSPKSFRNRFGEPSHVYRWTLEKAL